ncbi:MAG: MoCo/4Fe-4S cofactor protein with predicted Tat translocation signal [Planctomycetota bacterium]|jgi:MoCo/4Fe-4S cofactor protein with predicted Tat translocation signal
MTGTHETGPLTPGLEQTMNQTSPGNQAPASQATTSQATATTATTGEPTYWRSIGQLENSEEFQEVLSREFPEGITEAPDDVSRRGFLGAIAASVALAGMTSCRKPETKILPFTKRPEGFKPGIAQHYASTIHRNGYGIGVLVKSNDGRPTKIEGNPMHPSSLGGADLQLQAELLQLYDPNRSRHARNAHTTAHSNDDHGAAAHGGHAVDVWAELGIGTDLDSDHPKPSWLETASSDLLAKQGAGLHICMPPSTSPSLLAAVKRIKDGSFPKAKFHTWTALHRDNELQGAEMAFGKSMATNYDFAKADVVLSLDSDFLATDGNNLANARAWASRRREAKNLNRLYSVESIFSTTGTAADHRFRTKSSDIPAVVFALAKALGVGGGSDLATSLSSHDVSTFEKGGKKWLEIIAKDLLTAAGKSIVIAGPTQSPAVHAIVHAINAKLGNVGKTVTMTDTPAGMPSNCTAQLQELAAAMQAGTCETLVFLGTNPVLDAPADLEFKKLLHDKKPATTIHIGLYDDETGRHCDWHLPMAHDLEAWGDALSYDGTLSLQQPLIAPLHGGVSALEFLSFLNQDTTDSASFETLAESRDTVFGYELVKQHWRATIGGTDFEKGWWPTALHEGVVAGTAFATATASVNAGAIAASVSSYKKSEGIEVVLRGCPKMGDGRYANNSWMAELPDPLTKLSWDNAAMLSMATAKQLNVENGDMLAITANGGKQVDIPAWILPGHANDSISIFLGWGRFNEEENSHYKVAHKSGFDAYPLRTTSSQWILTGASVGRGSGSHSLVCTQEHGTMAGRALIRETDAATNAKDPKWAPKMSPLDQAARLQDKVEKDINKSLWEERGYLDGKESKDERVRRSDYQWGMVFDLNACTGCSSCVAACVAENNIPMVGKIQVARNREMFWIRADRYFSSRQDDNLKMIDDPEVSNMPVPCMQCENAPCESVCPVAATTHSPDGLNDMVYNRCIGTRYCSNNCPYKVRRYNYLDYIGHVPDTKQMAFNPDVTVRSRGVMEKCTYCVQRINGGRIDAKLNATKVGDGPQMIKVTTACAQACPTEAITFGNIIETDSKVAKLRGSDLNYGLLSELNTKPRTTYLGRVRNPNPELSKA